MTGTYDIQDVNITSGCLNVTRIINSNISRIYLLLKNSSQGIGLRGNVSLIQAVCFFIAQNRSKYNVSSFVQGNGNWTLQAYDDDKELDLAQPAYELVNVTIDHQLVKDITEEFETSSATSKY